MTRNTSDTKKARQHCADGLFWLVQHVAEQIRLVEWWGWWVGRYIQVI